MPFTEALSTREQALFIWVGMLLCVAIAMPSSRSGLVGVLKALLAPKLIIYFICFLCYSVLSVYCLQAIGIWDGSYMKDTIFWYASVGLVIAFNASKMKATKQYWAILVEAIKWTVLIEYLINFYTFNLWAELIMLPFIAFVLLLQTYSKLKKEYLQVERLMTTVLSLTGLLLFGLVLYKTFHDYQKIFVSRTVWELFAPLLFLVMYLPFAYCSSVYMAYETLWSRIQCMSTDEALKRGLKRAILAEVRMSLDKLTSVQKRLNKVDLVRSGDTRQYVKRLATQETI